MMLPTAEIVRGHIIQKIPTLSVDFGAKIREAKDLGLKTIFGPPNNLTQMAVIPKTCYCEESNLQQSTQRAN